MTLSNAPQGDEPTVMVTIPLAKGSQAMEKFAKMSELYKAFPKLTFVRLEPSGKDDLKSITAITVAGFASETEKLAKICKA